MIELDGSQHSEAEHQLKDTERDAELTVIGIKVLRFDDRQVLMHTEAVLEVIYSEVMSRLKNSNPS